MIVEAIAAGVLVIQMAFTNSIYISVCWYLDALCVDIIDMFTHPEELLNQQTDMRMAFKKAVLMHNAVLK